MSAPPPAADSADGCTLPPPADNGRSSNSANGGPPPTENGSPPPAVEGGAKPPAANPSSSGNHAPAASPPRAENGSPPPAVEGGQKPPAANSSSGNHAITISSSNDTTSSSNDDHPPRTPTPIKLLFKDADRNMAVVVAALIGYPRFKPVDDEFLKKAKVKRKEYHPTMDLMVDNALQRNTKRVQSQNTCSLVQQDTFSSGMRTRLTCLSSVGALLASLVYLVLA